MTRQMLIYENAEVITREAHGDLCVAPVTGLGFAAGLNSLPLLAAEFEQIAAQCPIVFAGEGEAMTPVALLGLAEGQNLFIDANGKWTARYLPAFLRRYPFIFTETPGDEDRLTLCIDTGFEAVNREGRGERLFDSDRNRTQYLENALNFTSEYQTAFRATRMLTARLRELDLMEPASINATLPDGQKLVLGGFQRVQPDRVHALNDAEILALYRSRMLDMIHLHLASLGQMQTLLDRLNLRMAAAKAA
ncbi:SapC family protein [Szabonella alba]|uniref:SapC family protein n=1 Tax=Szabonella alba TaxID=2804194 RepID=A0A8K0V868_9RHOB|nr:SapC family protein [Szabonella alba]MBL4917153.1 SapC family protein [Szabonella alba]